MSSNIHERGLRAAAAVTGRAQRSLVRSVRVPLGLALAAQLVSCQSTPQPNEGALVDPSNPPQAEQVKPPAPVCQQEEIKERVDCCNQNEFAAEGCEVCDPYAGEGRVEIEGCLSHYLVTGSNVMDRCKETLLKYHPDADEDQIMMSCTPWGPPAPPQMGALTLRQFLELEEVA